MLTALYLPAKCGQGCYCTLWEFQKRNGNCKVSAKLPASRNVKAKNNKKKDQSIIK